MESLMNCFSFPPCFNSVCLIVLWLSQDTHFPSRTFQHFKNMSVSMDFSEKCRGGVWYGISIILKIPSKHIQNIAGPRFSLVAPTLVCITRSIAIFTWTCRSPCRWYQQKWVCQWNLNCQEVVTLKIYDFDFTWFSWKEQRIPEAGWKVFSFHGGVVILDFFQAACLLLRYENNLEPDEPYSNTTFVQHRLCQSPTLGRSTQSLHMHHHVLS